MEVSSPPGTILGTVEQEWSIFCPTFAIKNASGDTVLRIEGPLCTMSICGDVEFKIMTGDGQTQVGKISKQWSGLVREMFTDTDYFGINFPMDLDVRMKAVMLGACFLIVSKPNACITPSSLLCCDLDNVTMLLHVIAFFRTLCSLRKSGNNIKCLPLLLLSVCVARVCEQWP